VEKERSMIYLKGANEIYIEGLKSVLFQKGYKTENYQDSNFKESNAILIYQMDLNIPYTNALSVIESFTKVILIVNNLNLSFAIKNIPSIKGIITDKCSTFELLSCIRSVDINQYYESKCSDCIFNKNNVCMTSTYNITQREYELLELLCKGLSTEKISNELFLSVNTVNTHKRNLMKKLSINRTSELILWGIQNKVVENK
jgi:DNA-binding NarL/FixJ family response regulator